MRILKPGGLFVAFTPNGSEEYRNFSGKSWDKLWGLVHPNFIDEKYYQNIFSNNDALILSNPYATKKIEQWKNSHIFDRRSIQLKGEELLVLAKK